MLNVFAAAFPGRKVVNETGSQPEIDRPSQKRKQRDMPLSRQQPAAHMQCARQPPSHHQQKMMQQSDLSQRRGCLGKQAPFDTPHSRILWRDWLYCEWVRHHTAWIWRKDTFSDNVHGLFGGYMYV